MQSCGVKNEPSTIEVVELLLKSSRDLWNSMSDDVDKYINILRKIVIEYDTISKKPGLVGEMAKKPILMALRKGRRGTAKTKFHSLASAREIYINDNPVYQKAFNSLIAPEENLIETLYKVCQLIDTFYI